MGKSFFSKKTKHSFQIKSVFFFFSSRLHITVRRSPFSSFNSAGNGHALEDQSEGGIVSALVHASSRSPAASPCNRTAPKPNPKNRWIHRCNQAGDVPDARRTDLI
ncbi:hypothetical protein EYF80_063547 [Liparis tanakae]|uniref:Uncharacterized protein n=1 Tax=Liparis tanakae TaxID=230148 RepID=A0A4Z2EBW1_9TELE|nr:hypothetical protein EYF80_063547 [Liparis tanakae]